MTTRVVIRDTQGEEDFELTGDLSHRQVNQLRKVAETVAHGTDWTVAVIVEAQR